MENNISQKHIKMENKKAVKLTDFQKNEENPFMKQAIEGIENHVVKKYKSNSGGDKRAVVALADTETGEVFKTSFIRQIEVDEEQFTKLYLSNFAAFFDLSQAAIRVFGYFMTCMKPKNDLIIFNRKKCLEYTKYKTDKAVYKGLAELVKAEIIARGPADNLWFINPLIVIDFMLQEIYETLKKRQGDPIVTMKATKDVGINVGINEQKVLELLRKNNQITAKEIAGLLGISLRHSERLITSLKQKGMIQRVGSNKNGYWEIIVK